MSEVIKIGVTKNHNQEIIEVNEITLIADKGIVGDRHFRDYNDPFNQLSIIESENIDEYNLNVAYIESQAFGYLAIRSFLNLPISYPKTTGCVTPTVGGKLAQSF